ncbi:MAG: hypothetical protein ACREOZ_01840, partial [Gloeomargaritales cyanobacterium]
HILFSILAFCSAVALAQYPNIDVGSPNNSSEVSLLHAIVNDTSRLFIAAKTPFPHIGHYYSADNGKTWSGGVIFLV